MGLFSGLLGAAITIGAVLLAGPGALGISGLGIINASTAYTMAITFGVSTLAARIFAPNVPQVQDNGVRQQVPPDTSTGVPVVYGEAFLGGKFCDAVLSTNQQIMWYTMAISCVSPNGTFTFDKTKFYYGDKLITFDTVEPAKVISLTDGAGNVDTKIAGQLYIYLYRSTDAGVITNLDTGGTSSGSGLPNTIISTANGAPSGQEWSATNRQMNGLAFAIVKLIYSRDAGTTSFSPITFHCSQTLNGTGVAKPGDVWVDYMTNEIYGGAVPSAFVDSTSATALNTYSDQLITFNDYSGSPSTQARYRINGVLDTGQTALSNVDKIMVACDCWMQYNAPTGKWAIVINKAESTSFAFNDTNIIGSINVGSIDITQTINQIEAKFNDKTNRDQANYVNEATPSGLLYPNEPVNKYTITFDLVNDSVQALYLANRILEQAREDLTVTINTTYVGIQVNAGDVISVTNDSYGWNAKLFRVMKVQEASLPDGNLGASLNLIEYNADVYDDSTINQYTPASNNGLASPNYFSSLTASTVPSSTPISSVPTFDVQVTIPTTGRVTFVKLFYTTSSTPSVSDWQPLDSYVSPNSQPITNGSTFTFKNESLPTGNYYFGYMVGNEIGQSGISSVSTVLNWLPAGIAGGSSRICYSKSTLGSLASTPTTITTSGSSSFPPNDSWGTGTVWQATSPTIVAGEYVYQSDGVYTPDTGNTVWNVPYLSTLKVGELSAISANLGDVTAGSMAIGTGGAISSTVPGYSLSGTTPPSPSVTGGRFYLGSTGYTYMDTPVVYGQLFGSTIGFKAGVTSPDAYFENTTSNANSHGVKAVIPGASSGYAFYTDQDAYIAGGVLPFTGVHQVLVKEDYALGDIMCDQQLINSNGFSNSIFYVEESTGANQPAIGVFVGMREWGSDSKPYALQNLTTAEYAEIVATYNLADVNAVGEGQINVCGEGGDIQSGDLIVTSSTIGKGMKQADDIVRNITVAKARESVTFSSPTEIKTIACVYLCG